MTEAEIQRAVFQQIAQRKHPDVLAWPVPNNPMARRTVGFVAGVHDVHILHRGKFYTMELKTMDGRPTIAQLEFRDGINNAGGYSFIPQGLDQAIAGLEAWGILRKGAA